MAEHTVAIIGAGAMGAGIAQVAVQAGWSVLLIDVHMETSERAIEGIHKRLDRLVEKERMTAAQRDVAAALLKPSTGGADLRSCDLLIEAIIEDRDIKVQVLTEHAAHLSPDAIIATNTSSLSVTEIAEAMPDHFRDRTLGMHFFNPAPLMKLVEVIPTERTTAGVTARVIDISESWGKKVARCADVPGFIVNHVARPYYLEAFRILEEGYADPVTIDDTMKSLGGFRMGPLELTDLIGQDVNTATTRSVWEQLEQPPLLAPSALQEGLVAKGKLGRKTGEGVYDYSTDTPESAVSITPREPELSEDQVQAIEAFTLAAAGQTADLRAGFVFTRVLCAIFVQACHAHERGVAKRDAIDTAIKFGVNYPNGPFDWIGSIGDDTFHAALTVLNDTAGGADNRFALPTVASA